MPISDARSSMFTPPECFGSKLDRPTCDSLERRAPEIPAVLVHCPIPAEVLLALFVVWGGDRPDRARHPLKHGSVERHAQLDDHTDAALGVAQVHRQPDPD